MSLDIASRRKKRSERREGARHEEREYKEENGLWNGWWSSITKAAAPSFRKRRPHVIISFHFISYHSLPDQYRSLAVLMVSKHKLLIVCLLLQTADKHFVNHDKHRLDSGRGGFCDKLRNMTLTGIFTPMPKFVVCEPSQGICRSYAFASRKRAHASRNSTHQV